MKNKIKNTEMEYMTKKKNKNATDGICHVCNLYKSHRRALQMLMTMFMFYS